jgi:hypothetical protein
VLERAPDMLGKAVLDLSDLSSLKLDLHEPPESPQSGLLRLTKFCYPCVQTGSCNFFGPSGFRKGSVARRKAVSEGSVVVCQDTNVPADVAGASDVELESDNGCSSSSSDNEESKQVVEDKELSEEIARCRERWQQRRKVIQEQKEAALLSLGWKLINGLWQRPCNQYGQPFYKTDAYHKPTLPAQDTPSAVVATAEPTSSGTASSGSSCPSTSELLDESKQKPSVRRRRTDGNHKYFENDRLWYCESKDSVLVKWPTSADRLLTLACAHFESKQQCSILSCSIFLRLCVCPLSIFRLCHRGAEQLSRALIEMDKKCGLQDKLLAKHTLLNLIHVGSAKKS